MKLSRDQFESLAMEHFDMLYRVARKMARDAHRAEDLVQETFLRAFRSADDFELKEYGIRPWLLRIMHNLHVTRGQKEARQPVSVEDEHLEAAGGISTSVAFADDALQGMDDPLKRAFEALPEEYRTAMHLWVIEELSYKEIAEALGVPVGTVMSRLHRARQRLSERLTDYARSEGITRE